MPIRQVLLKCYRPQIVSQNRTKVGKPRFCLQNQVIDFSFINIFNSWEARRPPERWNELKCAYPIPPNVTFENQKLKGNLNHDQNCHIQDDPAQVSSRGMLQVSDDTYEPARKNSINLLVVDDDRDILFTFKSILDVAGYNVEAFADPDEALSHFKQRDPTYYNLIITDIRMPKINGFQLYQKLKEINSGIRVLFTTAYEVPENMLDTMPNINDRDIIRKPIEEELFVNRIKTAINFE